MSGWWNKSTGTKTRAAFNRHLPHASGWWPALPRPAWSRPRGPATADAMTWSPGGVSTVLPSQASVVKGPFLRNLSTHSSVHTWGVDSYRRGSRTDNRLNSSKAWPLRPPPWVISPQLEGFSPQVQGSPAPHTKERVQKTIRSKETSGEWGSKSTATSQ